MSFGDCTPLNKKILKKNIQNEFFHLTMKNIFELKFSNFCYCYKKGTYDLEFVNFITERELKLLWWIAPREWNFWLLRTKAKSSS